MMSVRLMTLTLIAQLMQYARADVVERFLPQEYADHWLTRLTLNLVGYAIIIVPGYYLIQYLRRIRYDEHHREGVFSRAVNLCVFGDAPTRASVIEEGTAAVTAAHVPERSFTHSALLLTFCFFGLQVSYLTWGLLQERIMGHTYTSAANMEGQLFKDSQFLVFVNRFLSLLIGCLLVTLSRQPRHVSPMYKYFYCSFSNIMSSWFQYEALKFVSFPTQVLCKAMKVIPVMLMGRIVSRKTYPTYEYVSVLLLSSGIAMFLFSDHGDGDKPKHKVAAESTSISGLLLMAGYMAFDSFTSNWQDELFNQYKMSSAQMMTGVSLFTCVFTSLSLIEQGSIFDNLDFIFRYPEFLLHLAILSVCSSTGQLFIYYTISQFGPLTFTIIMTIRMALAILLSCYWYSHPVGLLGGLGIAVVFIALFGKIYIGQRMKRAAKKPGSLAVTSE